MKDPLAYINAIKEILNETDNVDDIGPGPNNRSKIPRLDVMPNKIPNNSNLEERGSGIFIDPRGLQDGKIPLPAQELNEGGIATPKRGFVDEPGSYAGKGRGNPAFTEPEKLYKKMAKEYDQVLQTAVNKRNFKNVPEFKEWAVENYGPEFAKKHYRKNVTKLSKLKYFDTQSKLLDTLIDEANQGLKYKSFNDLQEQAGYSRKTGIGAGKGTTKYGKLDTAEDKLKKGFDYLYSNPNKPVSEMFDSMTKLQELTGLNVSPGKYLKGYVPYEKNKRVIKNLSLTLSKQRLSRAPDLTLGELQFRVQNNVKDTNLFAPPRRMNMETKIMDIAGRHVKQGGKKIQWLIEPEKGEKITGKYNKAKFKYNGETYDLARLTQSADVDPNFKELFQIEDQIKALNAKEVIHPKTKQPVRFDDLMRETYGYKNRMAPYAVDHFKQISNEPFTSLRILPSRVNSSAGTTYQYGLEFITDSKKKEKYSKVGKEKVLKKIGYSYNKPLNELVKDELNLAEDVLVRNRKLRKVTDIVDELFEEGKVQVKNTSGINRQSKEILKIIGCGTGKSSGGRIGFQDGANCTRKGIDKINKGNLKDGSEMKNFSKLVNTTGAKTIQGVLKTLGALGIAGEAGLIGLESAVRMGMGDTFSESIKRSTDYLIPGDQTLSADMDKISRELDPGLAKLYGNVQNYYNKQEKLKSFENQKAELKNLGGSEFDYLPDSSEFDSAIETAKKDLASSTVTLENELFSERALDEAYDSSKSKSFISNQRLKATQMGGVGEDVSGLNFDLRGIEEKPERETYTSIKDMPRMTEKEMYDTIIKLYNAGEFGIPGSKEADAKAQDEYDRGFKYLPEASLEKNAQVYGLEQVYGFNPLIGSRK